MDTSELEPAHKAFVNAAAYGFSMTKATSIHTLVVPSYIASNFTDKISFTVVSIFAFNNGDVNFMIYEH